ncbi:unnamed protein product [Spirodela intermedia]|uniref:Uncharacterized protein n=1 Tax=Spirodela intermedia TaxID=51605 RepID=A0A7I8I7L0_SPIIN|nr:unnamed protein product [Spirodela intermedia]CAA6653597.1 unnamed protein product [Spirodela intermedia]
MDFAGGRLGHLLHIFGAVGGVQPEASTVVAAAAAPHPTDHDWILPFSVVIVLLACILSFTVLRCRQCKSDPAGGDGLAMDNECLIASVMLVLLVVAFLGSFYYYYCFQGGCFSRASPVSTAAAPPAGRKFMMTMTT